MGPCSNWGWRVWRPETESEYEDRIQKSIKAAKRAIKQKDKGLKQWGTLFGQTKDIVDLKK